MSRFQIKGRALGILFFSLVISSIFLTTISSHYHVENNPIINLRIKTSYPHPTINISNKSGLASHPNITGAGTELDPYIIQDMEIDAGGTGSCVNLSHTDKFLIIQNCTLNGSTSINTSGIFLYNCSNVNITDCTITGNYYGIDIAFNSSDIIIENCNISSNNNDGIHAVLDILLISNILINNNSISANGQDGIVINGSYNWIANNKIFDNIQDGIQLNGTGNYVVGNNISNNSKGICSAGIDAHIFYNNVLNNAEHGISIEWQSYSVFTWNNVSFNGGNGFYLLSTKLIEISSNTILSNDGYGIHLNQTSSTKIHHNTFNLNINGEFFEDNTVGTTILDNNCVDCNGAIPVIGHVVLLLAFIVIGVIPIIISILLYQSRLKSGRNKKSMKTPSKDRNNQSSNNSGGEA